MQQQPIEQEPPRQRASVLETLAKWAPLALAGAGAIALLAIAAVAANYNAAGWLARHMHELAAFAIVTEFAALVMVAIAEMALHARRHIAVRVIAFLVLAASAVGCEVFNAYGGFTAWQDTVAERAETLTEPRRNEIAANEARLGAAITEAKAAVAAAQARIDSVVKPDCVGAGPLTCGSRTQAWEAQTAPDRANLAAKQADLADAEAALLDLDRTIETPAAPFSDEVVWAFLAFIGFVKVFGPWAICVALRRSEAVKTAKRGTVRNEIGSDANVVSFLSEQELTALVRSMKDSGKSFTEIAAHLGRSRTAIFRLYHGGDRASA